MEAVILAAGRSRRLGDRLGGRPKCLLELAGRTLLDRHLANVAAVGVRRVAIVVGYRAEAIREACRPPEVVEVRFATNDRWSEGSILSMIAGLRAAGEGDLLLMDADVLYDPEVLGRLAAAGGSALLLDETNPETGEEMMLGVRDGRVRAIARRVGTDWDLVGEGVGFLRLAREARPLLLEIAERLVGEGRFWAEYEDALAELLGVHPVRPIRVGGLAWTEIDFPEDVEKAEREVLPRVLLAENPGMRA